MFISDALLNSSASVGLFYFEVNMAKSIEHEFYKSKEWLRCREGYLQRQGYFCERCKAKGIYEPAKIVHHRTHLTQENYKDASVAFNFDNLEALCQACHNNEHIANAKRYKVDATGRLIF